MTQGQTATPAINAKEDDIQQHDEAQFQVTNQDRRKKEGRQKVQKHTTAGIR